MWLLDTSTLELKEFTRPISPVTQSSHTLGAQRKKKSPSATCERTAAPHNGKQEIIRFKNAASKLLKTGIRTHGLICAALTSAAMLSCRKRLIPCTNGIRTRRSAMCIWSTSRAPGSICPLTWMTMRFRKVVGLRGGGRFRSWLHRGIFSSLRKTRPWSEWKSFK